MTSLENEMLIAQVSTLKQCSAAMKAEIDSLKQMVLERDERIKSLETELIEIKKGPDTSSLSLTSLALEEKKHSPMVKLDKVTEQLASLAVEEPEFDHSNDPRTFSCVIEPSLAVEEPEFDHSNVQRTFSCVIKPKEPPKVIKIMRRRAQEFDHTKALRTFSQPDTVIGLVKRMVDEPTAENINALRMFSNKREMDEGAEARVVKQRLIALVWNTEDEMLPLMNTVTETLYAKQCLTTPISEYCIEVTDKNIQLCIMEPVINVFTKSPRGNDYSIAKCILLEDNLVSIEAKNKAETMDHMFEIKKSANGYHLVYSKNGDTMHEESCVDMDTLRGHIETTLLGDE